NVRGANASAVSELVMGLIVCLTRRVVEMSAALRDGRWEQHLGSGLAGQTIGVVGTGAIGSAVIRRAHAFDMSIVAYSRTPNQSLVDQYGVHYVASLDDLLERSTIVSLHTPLTETTAKLIG